MCLLIKGKIGKFRLEILWIRWCIGARASILLYIPRGFVPLLVMTSLKLLKSDLANDNNKVSTSSYEFHQSNGGGSRLRRRERPSPLSAGNSLCSSCFKRPSHDRRGWRRTFSNAPLQRQVRSSQVWSTKEQQNKEIYTDFSILTTWVARAHEQTLLSDYSTIMPIETKTCQKFHNFSWNVNLKQTEPQMQWVGRLQVMRRGAPKVLYGLCIFHNRCWENQMVVKCCNAFVSTHYQVAFLLRGQCLLWVWRSRVWRWNHSS